ncbi:MAG TPA: hypothetical protein PKC24_02595 [Cyclobacteriaceae bacterium]|nr:hypothetical protein [Cyclobacteriaceae bacterium]
MPAEEQKTELIQKLNITGIDFGSRYAGTTVICSFFNQSFHLAQSNKKEDADAFLLSNDLLVNEAPIYIDAPLSLPGVYSGNKDNDDYFYREGDRALGAMSPMFIGGLTARAMRLKKLLVQKGHVVYETYPAGLAQTLQLKTHYKSDIKNFLHSLGKQFQLLPELSTLECKNWHQVDALLACLSGVRHQLDNAKTFGHSTEGLIII